MQWTTPSPANRPWRTDLIGLVLATTVAASPKGKGRHVIVALVAAIGVMSVAPSGKAGAPTATVTAKAETACELTVLLQCQVAADGATSGCDVVSEDPNSLGAGAAALAMSRSFRLAPRDVAERVLVPVRIQSGVCRGTR